MLIALAKPFALATQIALVADIREAFLEEIRYFVTFLEEMRYSVTFVAPQHSLKQHKPA